jgi:hypothetical protein
MSGPRRSIRVLTAAWLLCQLATPLLAMTLVPTLAAHGAADAAACACPHGDETGVCPMHKMPADTTRCRLRRGGDTTTAALLGLSSVVGFVPVAMSVTPPWSPGTRLVVTSISRFDRAVRPDWPPPRR